ISGQNRSRVFNISAGGPVTIDDLTIANGSPGVVPQEVGGGLADFSTTLNVVGVTFANNQALLGGGIGASFGTVNVTNCLFTNNRAVGRTGSLDGVGGGAIFSGGCNLTVDSTQFTSNTALGVNQAMTADSNPGFDLGLALGGAVRIDSDDGDNFIDC